MVRFRTILAGLVLFPVSSQLALGQRPGELPSLTTERIDQIVQKTMKEKHLPGLSLAIVKDGKVMEMKEYGVCDRDSKKKVDENTLFRIGSCTKAFTATCVTLLDYQKKLSLDAVTSFVAESVWL